MKQTNSVLSVEENGRLLDAKEKAVTAEKTPTLINKIKARAAVIRARPVIEKVRAQSAPQRTQQESHAPAGRR
jgi:hypothetical protein